MATANTISHTSSRKTSKKQKVSNVNTNTNSPLTNLLISSELLAAPATHTAAQQEPETPFAASETVPSSLWEGIKNSSQFSGMITGLACAFFVSTVFYCAAKTMMKTKFEEMFGEKLPRYKNLVYSIGSVQNIDVDHILLRDDLNDQYFVLDEENGSITIDVQRILEQYKPEPAAPEILLKHNTKNVIQHFQDDQIDSVRGGLLHSKQQSSVEA